MPDADDTEDRLIDFVRGRLAPDEAARVAAEAAARPELAAEIATIRGIIAAFDDEASEPAPGALGWARLSRAIDAEPRRAQAPARKAAAGGRWRPRRRRRCWSGSWPRCRC